MKFVLRNSMILALVATAAACSGKTGGADAGDNDSGVFTNPIITASGTLSLFPTLADWYTARGATPPSFAGIPLVAEEPLLSLENNPNADLAKIPSMPANGAFQFTGIDTGKIVLGLIASLRDARPIYGEGDGGFDAGTISSGDGGFVIPAGYAQFPRCLTPMAQGRPSADLTNVAAYAFTFDFLAYLDGVMGTTGAQELLTQGFIFGIVVDASSNPVSGVSVKDSTGQIADSQISYLNDTITAMKPTSDPTTGAKGVFVIPNAGASGAPPSLVVIRSGNRDLTYASRLAGSTSGDVFQLVMAPH
jgi:hypothetical protein